MSSPVRKRIVLWGTGVVGSMVAAELVDHPAFELVGVGVSHPAKVGPASVRPSPDRQPYRSNASFTWVSESP